MIWYSTSQIKEVANCKDIAQKMLGIQLNSSGRCVAEWRNGKNLNVAVMEKGFKDHKTGEKGSVIDFVMLVKKVDLMQAVEELGQFLGLEKDPATRLPDESQPMKLAQEWIYEDLEGNPIHKTVRYNLLDEGKPKKNDQGKIAKTFKQFYFKDGKWIAGLNKIKTIPYNIKGIHGKKVITLHEGEKAADAGKKLDIPSTTFAMGAGKWKDHYKDYFKKVKLIIVADNDDAGKKGAQEIAYQLKNTCEAIKIITVSDIPKGDMDDFVEAGGTKEKFFKLCKEAPKAELKNKAEPKAIVADKALEKAKAMNKSAFKNYRWATDTQGDGNEKKSKVPISVNELTKNLYDRLLGYPRTIGKELFDYDRDTGKITMIQDVADLFAWIAQKTNHNPYWTTGQGYVTKQEFFSAILRTAVHYDIFSNSPEFPTNPNTYYLFGDLPEPTKDLAYFNKFCCFFCPATPADALLLQAFFTSLVFYFDGAKRPMWVIDTETGDAQATGKTTLAELASLLIGGTELGYGEPFWVRPKEANTEQSLGQVSKRLLSGDGRKKKVFLVDNIDSYFKSASLASFATQSSFSGMAPYGRGETSRTNNMTFVLTCNGATLSKDIISRSMFIKLKKPTTYEKDWEIKVRQYIKNHRLQIVAEIVALLKGGVDYELECNTRFKEWERAVLGPICPTKVHHEHIVKEIKQRKVESDGEVVEADLVREVFIKHLKTFSINPDTQYVWIPTAVLRMWGTEAMPALKHKVGAITHILKNHNKTGALRELRGGDVDKYPKNTAQGIARTRGMMWSPDGIPIPKGHNAKIIVDEGGTPNCY